MRHWDFDVEKMKRAGIDIKKFENRDQFPAGYKLFRLILVKLQRQS